MNIIKQIRKSSLIYLIILLSFICQFSFPQSVQADTWIQTTATDFNAGTLTAVEMIGAGADAEIKIKIEIEIVINKFSTGVDWCDLYNYGPHQDMTGWTIYLCEPTSIPGGQGDAIYTFPAGFILSNQRFVRLHEWSGTDDSDDLYIEENIWWMFGQAAAITLADNASNCIDTVYWDGCLPIHLTNLGYPVHSWSGWIILPADTVVGRNSDIDTDTAGDWDQWVGTNKSLNPGQTGIPLYTTGTFISSVFDSGNSNTFWNSISWTENILPNTDITFATRTGNTLIPDASWKGWSSGLSNSAGLGITSPKGRFIQYRATLYSIDGLYTPILSDVTVIYTPFPCIVNVIKNTDIPGGSVSVNSNNISVLSFKITDSSNHPIKTIKIFNNGDMADSTDIAAVKLWWDVNGDFQWDSGDIQTAGGPGVWSPAKLTWDFNNLAIKPGTNLVVTIDTAPGGISGRTFQAGISPGHVICSNNLISTNNISNTGIITMSADTLFLTKNADTPEGNVARNSNNITILAFNASDSFGHLISEIRIGNLGTMSNGTDISAVNLWYDAGGQNSIWDTNDIQIDGPGVWNAQALNWYFTGLSIPSGTNIVATLDISGTALNGRTFKGYIDNGYILCSNGIGNIASITNNNHLTVLSPWDGVFPFYDEFPDIIIDPSMWGTNNGTSINENGINEPSGIYSLNIEGGESIESVSMDLSSYSYSSYRIVLSYYWERQGGGYPVEYGEFLYVQYLNSSLIWTDLAAYTFTNGTTTAYSKEVIYLPKDIFHSNFKIRFTNTGKSGGLADFFVDNVHIYHLPKVWLTGIEQKLDNAVIYPNPYKPNDGDPDTGTDQTGIIFDELSRDCTVTIFDLQGNIVKKIESVTAKAVWDVSNEKGDNVASGIYIVYIENLKGDKFRGKLLIVK